jgi:hypothetical protein
VIEAILASLSLRASDANLTILIVGMLVGFFCLCAMVFVLTVHPRLRYALLGGTEVSPAKAIQDYGLTANDIRFIVAFRASRYPDEAEHVLMGDKPLPLEARLKKLKQLGLIEATRIKHGDYGLGFLLTIEGRELAALINTLSQPMIELCERDKTGK